MVVKIRIPEASQPCLSLDGSLGQRTVDDSGKKRIGLMLKVHSIYRFLALGTVTSMMALAASAQAATVLFWDPNGAAAGEGGGGNWNTSSSFWRSGSIGGALQTWNNVGDAGGAFDANLPSANGTITLQNPITLGNLTALPNASGGYVINGTATNRLTFANAAASISSTTNNLTINAPITTAANSVLSIFSQPSANSAVTLGGSNTIGGSVLVKTNSKLHVNNASALSGATSISTETGASFQVSGVTISGVNLAIAGGRTTNVAGGSSLQGLGTGSTFAGNVTFNAAGSIGHRSTGAFDITGQILGSGNITINTNSDAYGESTVQFSNAANSYSGNLTINRNTLRLGNSEVLSHGAGKGNIAINAAGILDVNGKSETINGLTGFGTVNNGAGNGLLVIGDNNQSSTFAGNITNTVGTLSIQKVGSGTLTLNGTTLSYAGSTTVSNGLLDVNSALTSNAANQIFIAKDANDDFNVGAAPELKRAVAAATSIAGFGATEIGGLGTVASILAGSTNAATSVDMAFRGRNNAIVAGETSLLSSDVLKLEGLDGVVFVLQMSYNEAIALANGQAENTLRLGYLNTALNRWEDAILGNHGPNTGSFHLSGYADAGSPLDLGSFGVDLVNNVVWAVLDHNSYFAVIPAPAALPAAMLLMGLAAAKRRRHA
jgi:autotransporter-associated beta strand protein